MSINLSQWPSVSTVKPGETKGGGGGPKYPKLHGEVSTQLAAEYVGSLCDDKGNHPSVDMVIRILTLMGYVVLPKGWKAENHPKGAPLGPKFDSVSMRVRYYGHEIDRDPKGNVTRSRRREKGKLERLFAPCEAEPFQSALKAALTKLGGKGGKDDKAT